MKEILFITRKWRGTGGMQRYSRDLRRCLRESDVRPRGSGRCIHLGDAALAPLGWLLRLVTRSRVTITAHGLDLVYPLRPYRWLLRLCLPSMDMVVCVSHAAAAQAERLGVSADRIVIIPNGVWPQESADARMRRVGTGPLLLTVGRLVRRKGVAWFIAEVLPLLRREFPELRYHVIGSGPEENSIKKIIQAKGLSSSVSLRGEVGDAERDAAYASADLFVMPNISVPGDMEGFGVVCIEAGARGLPVAAAKIEGLCDAVREGETGFFFEPGRAADAASVIRRMLREPMDPSAVSRATLRHFSWPDLFRRYRHEVFRI